MLLGCGLWMAAASARAQNPFTTPADVEKGGRLFVTLCSYCHGVRGEGGRGADLTTGRYRAGGTDAELFSTIRNGLRGTEMPASRASDDDIWRMTAFVKGLAAATTAARAEKGDAAAGRTVYDAHGCAQCHLVNGEGGSLGPNLTTVGRRRGVAHLEEALTRPEADIGIEYRGVRAITADGREIAGVRLNEDDISIQLRVAGDGIRSFLKESLREIRRDRPSLMPAYQNLPRKQLEDLVAYLSSLRSDP